MGETIAEASAIVTDAAVRLAILAAAAEWVTRRCSPVAPHVAHGAWRVVLASAIVLPAAAAWVPAWALVRPDSATAAMVAAAGNAGANALPWVYAAGLIVAASRLGAGMMAVRRLRRGARLLPADDLRRLDPMAQRCLPAARAVQFRECAAIATPATIGCYRAVVLLPPAWRRWPERRLAAVVGHELAHVARRDFATGLAAAIVRAIWWWHPAAWLLVRRLSLTAELACDALASQDAGPVEYADDLLAMASEASSPWTAPAFLPGAASSLSARVDALLAPRDDATRARSAGPLVVATAALCLTLPVRLDPLGGASVSRPSSAHGFAHGAAHAITHGAH